MTVGTARNATHRRGSPGELRRAGLFVVVAYGIAGATALAIHLTGGLDDSPVLVTGTPITVAFVLLPTAYMFAPAAAHVLTRHLTREGWSGMRLRPRLATGWCFWLLGWLLPVALTLVGAVAFFALFPASFEPSLAAVREQLARAADAAGQPVPLTAEAFLVVQLLAAVVVAPVVNSIFAFGEEFGWRAYLQPKLLSVLSPRSAMVTMGLVWGAWHWPLIAMGYEYGTGYPGFPWAGMLLFLLFACSAGTLLGWLAYRGGSAWPAVVGHASINATAGLALPFFAGGPSALLGPLPVGLVGSVGFVVAALWILSRWSAVEPPAGNGRPVTTPGATSPQ